MHHPELLTYSRHFRLEYFMSRAYCPVFLLSSERSLYRFQYNFVQYTRCGADNPTLEKALVTKFEEAISGYFSWQKLLRKARAHVGLSIQ
jgi:hypothetical protein